MTPIQFAYDNGQKTVMSFIRDLTGIDYSNSNSFSEFAKISDNFFIKNKKAEVSDDDDFLKLEEEANKDFGDEHFDDVEDNEKSSNVSSFDPSDEKNKLKYGRPKLYFSSDENSDFERDTSYMPNYLKSILSAELFTEFKKAQEKDVPLFKMIEIPESLKRPFQISQDFSDLIIDMINELIESDDLRNVDYESYIEKLSNLFLTENHEAQKFKEDSHKLVIDAYNNAFKKNCGLDCAEFIFSRSDEILKEQMCYIIGLGIERKPENSELETLVIEVHSDQSPKKSKKLIEASSPIMKKSPSPQKKTLVCPEPPLIPPPPPPDDDEPPTKQKEAPKAPLRPPSPPLVPPSPPPYDEYDDEEPSTSQKESQKPPSPSGSQVESLNDSPQKVHQDSLLEIPNQFQQDSMDESFSQSEKDSLLDSSQKVHQDSLLEIQNQSQQDSLLDSHDQNLPDSMMESPNNSQNESILDSADQSLFESPIESVIESPNQSLLETPQGLDDNGEPPLNESTGVIDENQLEELIKAALPSDMFDQMSQNKSEGKLPEMIPNDKNEEIIDFINFYAQMDDLTSFTYDEYIQHLVNAYMSNGEEEEEAFIDENVYSKDYFSDDNNN